VDNRVIAFLPANLPEHSATASEQSTEVVGVNQNATLPGKFNHLLWGLGGIEVSRHPWVTIHQEAEVIQHIQ